MGKGLIVAQDTVKVILFIDFQVKKYPFLAK